jgi:hypothetical protein
MAHTTSIRYHTNASDTVCQFVKPLLRAAVQKRCIPCVAHTDITYTLCDTFQCSAMITHPVNEASLPHFNAHNSTQGDITVPPIVSAAHGTARIINTTKRYTQKEVAE